MKKFQSKKEVLHYIFVQPFKVLLSPFINLIKWWTNLPFDAPPNWDEFEKILNEMYKSSNLNWTNMQFLKNHPNFGLAKPKRIAGCWCTYRVYNKKYVITYIDAVFCVFHLSDFYTLTPDSSDPYSLRINK